MLQNAPFDAQDLMQRIANDLMDSYDEELELEIEDRNVDEAGDLVATDKLARQQYFKDLFRLQGELVKLQDWVQHSRQKVVILFEGRDAAGKGGVIKRITQRLNPRVARVAALPAPNDRERTQWYFQRYVAHHADLAPFWRLMLVTGFLGALTTFSSFSAEVVEMALADRWGAALSTAALHLLGSLALTWLGIQTARFFIAASD